MLQLSSSDTNVLTSNMLNNRESPPNSPGPANLNTSKMLLLHNNNMDGTSGRSHDLSGRCSPIILNNNNNADNNKSMINFGFTQEQVECVCEVITNKIMAND